MISFFVAKRERNSELEMHAQTNLAKLRTIHYTLRLFCTQMPRYEIQWNSPAKDRNSNILVVIEKRFSHRVADCSCASLRKCRKMYSQQRRNQSKTFGIDSSREFSSFFQSSFRFSDASLEIYLNRQTTRAHDELTDHTWVDKSEIPTEDEFNFTYTHMSAHTHTHTHTRIQQ